MSIISKILFFLIIFWGLVIFMRGNFNSIALIFNKIYDRIGLLFCLCPIIYFALSVNVVKNIIRLFVIMSILFSFFVILFSNNILQEQGYVILSQLTAFLGSASVILIYYISYLKKSSKIIIIISLSLLFIMASLLARRGIILDIGIAILLNVLRYILFTKSFVKKIGRAHV